MWVIMFQCPGMVPIMCLCSIDLQYCYSRQVGRDILLVTLSVGAHEKIGILLSSDQKKTPKPMTHTKKGYHRAHISGICTYLSYSLVSNSSAPD